MTFDADALIASGIAFDRWFGPAYKGITLAPAAFLLAHSTRRRDRDAMSRVQEGRATMRPSGKLALAQLQQRHAAV